MKDKLNASIIACGGKALVDIGSCNLHILHNGFKEGLASVEKTWSMEEFVSDIFQFFKKYLSRKEEMDSIQRSLNMDKKASKRFVSNRWLSMRPVCRRIIENWLSLIEYFLNTEQTKSI